MWKIFTDEIKISRQNLTSSSGSSGSHSDPEEKQPPRKRSEKQELSDDDVIKDVNELIGTSNKQTTDLPICRNRQSWQWWR